MEGNQVSWSFGSILVGYIGSAAVAAASLVMFMSHGPFDHILPMIILGTCITLLAGLPGFAAALVVCRQTGWQTWLHFGIAGGFNALLAGSMFSVPIPAGTSMFTSYFGAGFVGGMTYWAIARWCALRTQAIVSS
jgi:hypothetical protein